MIRKFTCPLKRCKKVHNEKGYVLVPPFDRYEYLEHRVIVEKALGKQLPHGAVVHHINGIKCDNRPSNLVVCPDQDYHHLLHQRQHEKKWFYTAGYKYCKTCKMWHVAPVKCPVKQKKDRLRRKKQAQLDGIWNYLRRRTEKQRKQQAKVRYRREQAPQHKQKIELWRRLHPK